MVDTDKNKRQTKNTQRK